MPYTIRSTLASLVGRDPSLTEAGLVLGANEPEAFWSFTLPLIRTGIITGAIFAFAVSLIDVAVSTFLTDPETYTLPVALVSAMRASFDLTVAAAAVMLMAVTALLIFVLDRVVGFNRVIGQGHVQGIDDGNSLEFQSATKTFGSVAAIDGVSFDIAHGETVALLGPSGCGKTTIRPVISGFETPDSGSVRIAGTDVARKRPYERNIGLLFQHYALFPHMTVETNVAYGLRHRGFPKADIPRRVAEMLQLVKLPGYGDRFPNQLSGGQQQRVALARALATSPGVVLLDEPLSALDAKLRHELRTELREVLATVGSSAIVVTHDHEEAMSLGESVFIMNRGRIVQQGTPDDIYARPQSRFVAEFMGRSNWFAGSLRDAATFQSTCGLTLQIAPVATIGACDLCVRPESVDLLPESTGAGPNRVPGRVVDVALLGAVRQIVVALHGRQQVLVAQPNRMHTGSVPGQNVVVSFAPDACMVVPTGLS